MNVLKRLFCLSAITLAVVSCAVEGDDNTSEAMYNRVLASWVKINYPAKLTETTDSGAYILDFKEGKGEVPSDTAFVFVHYVKTDLEGTISNTNSDSLAYQIRSYTNSAYYGPNIWQLGYEAIPVGLEEVLLQMKAGGCAKVALPMAASEVTNTLYTTFSDASEDDNVLYTIWLDRIENDIYQYQKDSLERYRDIHYPGLDSLEEGFYFKKLVEYEGDDDEDEVTDTIPDGTTVYIRYIGRRVEDGKVFDTNFQDTAKKYRIYNSSSSYDFLTATYYHTETEMIANNSDLIEGFGKIISRMNKNEQAVGFFWSKFGYGESGSSTSIPEYGMLEFTIWLYDSDE